MAETPIISNPFIMHNNRMRRNSLDNRWVSDYENATRQSQEQASPRNKAQHLSEPCPLRTSLENTGTHGDLEGISPPIESGQQIHGLEERASVHSAAWYQAVKAIYDSGPEGEGQEMWKAWRVYQRARKERKDNDETSEMRMTVRQKVVSEGEKIPAQAQHTRPLVPDRPPPPPPQVDTFQNQLDGTEKGRAKKHTREDSCVSPSSIDIPVTIGDCIQRAIDMNKPLPAVPHPEPAPKTDETVRQMVPASPPLAVKPFGNTKSVTKQLRSEAKSDYTWWKKRQSPKVQATLKSKISHPVPLMASYEGSVTNVASECGGVGGPAAAVSLPITRTRAAQPQPQPQSRNNVSTASAEQREVRRLPPLNFHFPSLGHNRMKSAPELGDKDGAVAGGDLQPTHWSDTFVGPAYEAGKSIKQSAKDKLDGVDVGRRRRSSDASFGCQGIVERGLDRYQVSGMREPSQSAGEDKTTLVPEPLFSGRRGGRNTQFYQLYIDVLDEY